MATTATFTPLYVCEPCQGGTVSMHGSAIDQHLANWHGPTMPATLRMLTEMEHAVRGWDVSEYPHRIR
jgi:hypothetical protein